MTRKNLFIPTQELYLMRQSPYQQTANLKLTLQVFVFNMTLKYLAFVKGNRNSTENN